MIGRRVAFRRGSAAAESRLTSAGGNLVRDGAMLDRLLVEVHRRAPAPPARRGRHARDLRLAVRAELPRGVQRLAAVAARVLELAHARGAAQEVLLDLVVAVRAELEVEVAQPRLGGLHLQLALADVL